MTNAVRAFVRGGRQAGTPCGVGVGWVRSARLTVEAVGQPDAASTGEGIGEVSAQACFRSWENRDG